MLKSRKLLGALGPVVGLLFRVSLYRCVSMVQHLRQCPKRPRQHRLHQSGGIFNVGLVLSGSIVAIFSTRMLVENRSWKYSIWELPLLAAGLDLALIGVFPENSGRIHYVVSVIFFSLITITTLLYSYASWRLGRPRTGALALVSGIVMAAIWLVEWPWSGVAIQEALSASLAAMWLVTVVYQDSSKKQPRVGAAESV